MIISTLVGVHIVFLLICYDIACQYHKKFPKRISDHFSPEIQLNISDIKIQWAIPKKHIIVHGPNHSQYSLNFLPGVGRTYGEGIESSWSHMNPVSMSTKEMGPAMRHEALDDHWSSWNWIKIQGLGTFSTF